MSKKSFKAPQGTRDVLPEEQIYWDKTIRAINSLARSYGFEKIDPPFLEDVELFLKASGKSSDQAEKEICVLKTAKGEKFALRPETTSSCIRAYLENKFFEKPHPVKFYTLGPVFRYRKAEGGFCQSYQAGFETVGSGEPVMDAHLIQLCFNILSKEIGLKNLVVQINSSGCKKCGSNYRRSLVNFLKRRKRELCPSCQDNLRTNPLWVLGCDDHKCQEITRESPQMIEYLCSECRNHFKSVLEYLDELEVPYFLNSFLIRGLGYQTKTVFDVFPDEEEGGCFRLAGGSRYDDLIRFLGGKSNPGAGFVLELDKVIELMKQRGLRNFCRRKPLVFLVQIGELGRKKSLKLFESLRKSNIEVASSFAQSTLNAQLKEAERQNAQFSLVVGQKEALDDTVMVRDMETGSQEIVPLEKITQELRKKIKN